AAASATLLLNTLHKGCCRREHFDPFDESIVVLVGAFQPASAPFIDLAHFSNRKLAIFVLIVFHRAVHEHGGAEVSTTSFSSLAAGSLASRSAFAAFAAHEDRRLARLISIDIG